jgi:hypothetical protein
MFIEQLVPQMIVRKLSDAEMDAIREPFTDPSTRLPLWRWPNGFCQNSGLSRRQDRNRGLTTPALRFGVGRFLALQHATLGLQP